MSFVTWTQTNTTNTPSSGTMTAFSRYYLPYGIATASGLLAARTGSASYVGIVHGDGASLAGARYDIAGSAQFTVDFSNTRYLGNLALAGQPTS